MLEDNILDPACAYATIIEANITHWQDHLQEITVDITGIT